MVRSLGSRPARVLLPVFILALVGVFPAAAQGLTVEIINGYNLVVDSNVTSPSTYAPSAGYIGARVCNTSASPASNVILNTGNYNGGVGSTPGVFPVHNSTGDLAHPQLTNTGNYSLTLESDGTPATIDGTRYIGTLAPNQCVVQYWLISYPQCVNVGGVSDAPPCATSITGDVQPTDDLSLNYDIWATSTTASTVNVGRSFTLRNEISAAANKIWPNTDSKVPNDYLAAIQSLIGWGTLGPDGQPLSATNPVYPGQRVITTQGIWYDLGNVGQGFDNDGDLVPDQNAWLQPVGDAAAFDADCFRMVNVYGLLIVKLKTGGELLIPFQNELYFEHIPDNTGVVGLVYYQFIATDAGCSAAMTPYQEAASGFDNEKFSADFGLSNNLTSGPWLPNFVFAKTAPATIDQGSQMTYTLNAPNLTPTNLGAPDYGVPATFTETIPAGTTYVAGSALDTPSSNLVEPAGTGTFSQGYTDNAGNLDQCTIGYSITSSSFVVRFSNNNGATWTLNEPAGVTNIQWMLFTTMNLDGGHDGTSCITQNGSYDNGTLQTSLPAGKTATVNFRVTVNAGPYICNTGRFGFGGAVTSTTSQACTIVNGINTISGSVFEDIGAGTLYANGVKDAVGETGIGTVTVWLYYDADANGELGAGDVLLTAKTVNTTGGTGAFTFNNLPDGRFLVVVDKSDSDGAATSLAEVRSGWGNTTRDPGLALTLDQGAVKMSETPAVVAMAVNLDLDGSAIAAASVTNVNFGFAPPLRLTKTATNNPDAAAPAGVADTAYDEGDFFSYSILAENRLPAVGHQGPLGCQYTMWATTGANGSPAQKEFTNPSYAWDGPNRTVASTLVTGGGLSFMDGTGFVVPTRPGNVIKVEALYMGYFSALLTDDTLSLKITSGALNNTRLLSTGMIDSYSSEPADLDPDSAISWDVTALKPGGGTWSWADNFSTLRLEVNPSKASNADQKTFFLDAIGLRITTDQNCASSSSTTLSPVPLQDDYDQTRVDFVSATPPPTSVDLVNGIIKWDDIGPIEAGASELVTVNVRARNVTGTQVAPNTTQNAFDGKHVLYADNRLAIDGTSSMSVTIVGKGEIRGTLWSDRNQSGWAIDNTEPVVPNAPVTLWACVRSTGVLETTSNNKTCQATTNGNNWVAISTTTTNASGAYEFIGLDSGFYLVEVGNTDNAPGTGNAAPFSGAQRAEPNDTQATTIVSGNTWTANGTNGVCAACNNTWGDPNANTNALQLLNSPNGEEIINGVNFGYYFANAVISGNIWWDIDGDAVFAPEPGESGLTGFTVQLYNNSNVLVGTTTTDANGNYSFGSLGTGTYSIRVTPPLLPSSAWAETHETTGGATNLNNEIVVSVLAGDISSGHRFGYTIRSSGSIGDTLFYDFNENGVQDATEGGIPNVTVSLYADVDRDGTIDAGVDEVLATTVTSANGQYLFSLLPAGSYIIVVDTADPDFPDNVTPTADPDVKAASIGDTIFYDANGNGTQDAADDGIPFVVVNLYSDVDTSGTLNAGDLVIASAATNVLGKYLFTGLSAGSYFVDIDETSLPSTDLALTTTDLTLPAGLITLNASTAATTFLGADAGYSPAANYAIGNRIWHDVDNDGVQDPGEPGIPFVDVLISAAGTPCATPCRVTTNAEGFWIKTGLPNATYSVSVDTADADFPRFFIVTPGTTNPRNAVVSNADLMNVDFGYRYDPGSGTSPTGTISGRMFLDLDGDLAFDAGEARASRTVNLLDSNGHVVASTTTAADGTYAFNGIFIGDYSVQGIDPLGTRYTVIFVAGAQAFSNLNLIFNNATETAADSMSAVSIDGVHPDLLQDFGYKRFLGSIGDSIYWDVNENGTQDLGEPGFAGVTVRLYEVTWTDSNNNGMFEASVDGVVATQIATTTTIADNPLTPANEGGTYIFANLDEATAGRYYVVIPDAGTLPAGATYTLIADPDTDGAVCTALPPGIPSTVCDGQKLVQGFFSGNNYLGADFGYRAIGNDFATIGDSLWIDSDGDGVKDSGEVGIDAVTVWLDTDGDGVVDWTDGNANGVWDLGEGERWTVSDPDGYYVFTAVANGTYNLKVLTSDPDWPSGLATTPTFEVRSGNTASRNNAVVVTVASGAVSNIDDGDPATTDSCSSCNLSVDFGYRYAGTNVVNGTVCIDDPTKNGYCGATATTYSGVDAGIESALAGIFVTAYRWTDDGDNSPWAANGTLDSGDTFQVIGSTSTDANGDYSFGNLPDNVVFVFSVSDTQNLRLTTTNANSSVEDANVIKRAFYEGTDVYNGNTVTVLGRQALSMGGDADDIVRDLDWAFDGTLGGSIAYDFGDLPAGYGNTLLADSGARQLVTNTSIYLGPAITTESDGRQSATASLDGADDGVLVRSTSFPPGGSAQVDVTASAGGWLAAWIDFNNDGDFDDAGEWILDRAVNAGTSTLTFSVPASAPANSDFFARFRIYPSRPAIVASNGPAINSSFQLMGGEVEDYLFSMFIGPTMVDMFSMDGVQGKRGVTLSWQTSREVDNLGFHVYRQVPGGPMEKLNKHVITGSAFVTGRRSGPRSYRFVDRNPVAGFAQYFIEDLDLNGTKTMHGPITARMATSESEEPPVTTEPDPTLGSLGGIFTTQPGMGVTIPAPPAPTTAQRDEQWQLAAVPAVKVSVTKPGWYRVKKSDLTAAGFDAGDNGKALSVYTDGTEVPVLVNAKNEGKFTADDSIEFFGRGIDMPGTGARIYYITARRGSGLRVKSTGARGSSGSPAPASFAYTFERIEKTVFFTALTNNGDRENFYGAVLTTWPIEQPVPVTNRDPNGMAQLELAIQGATEGMEHVVEVKLNGSAIGFVRVNGSSRHVEKLDVYASQLLEGDNVVTLTAQNGWDDVSVLESLRLTYPHRFRADNDALSFSVPAGTKVAVGGFSTDKVKVIDVTDPMVPQVIEADVTAEAGGSKSVSFATTGNGTRVIFAFAETRVLAPAQIAWNEPSTWNATSNAANLVIITNRAFTADAKRLEAARDAQGIATTVVDVQNVYDEFSYGHHGPEAIRDFLKQTQKWKTAPRYVILLGDASFDPRNYIGFGSWDFVPTKLVPTAYLKAPSDDWFADFNGTGIPSLAIGRIPARTVAQAKAIVDKLIARGAAAPSGGWAQNVTIVADSTDGTRFERAASDLATTVPGTHIVERINLATTPSGSQAIVDSFSRGSILTTWVGHGSVELWGTGVFSSWAATALNNGNRLPFVVAMNCLNGYFHDLFSESIAEALMNNGNGGAIGVWASSALSGTSSQLDLTLAFNRNVFGATPKTVGDAAILAKQATQNGDVRRTWILFGDPTIKLK